MVQLVVERSPLRVAAYREAGHSAAAFDHGQQIREINVLPGSDTLGALYLRQLAQIDLSPPISLAAKDLLERKFLIVLSGPAAEDWFRRVPSESWDEAGKLAEVVSRLYPRDAVARAYLEYIRAQVDAWLAQPVVQRTINLIATSLVARRKLTGGEARILWQQAKLPCECLKPEPIPFPKLRTAQPLPHRHQRLGPDTAIK